MTGPDDTPPAAPPEAEPPWLRRLRNLRTGFDLAFPPFVAVAVVGCLVAVVSQPELQSPAILGVLGTALAALGGLGLRRGR